MYFLAHWEKAIIGYWYLFFIGIILTIITLPLSCVCKWFYQAFKGASQRQLIKKVPLAVEQKRRSLPIHTKPSLPSRPVHSIAASPSGVFTEHSQSCSDDFGSGACTSPVAGDMDVLSYLLSLNTNDVMKMLASEAVTDPRLYGRLLHQYFPWQGSSMVKWRCLGLQILQPAWITGCVGLTAVRKTR